MHELRWFEVLSFTPFFNSDVPVLPPNFILLDGDICVVPEGLTTT